MILLALPAVLILCLVSSGSTRPPVDASNPAKILNAYKTASGGDAWEGKSTLRLTFSIAAFGMRGTGTNILNLINGERRLEYTLGPMSLAEGYDGVTQWEKDKSGTIRLEQGKEDQALAVNDAYRVSARWWKSDRGGAVVAFAREERLGTGGYQVLTITPIGGTAFEAWFDSQSGLLFRTVERHGPETVAMTFSDYRVSDGVKLPYAITIDRGHGEKYKETRMVSRAEFTGPMPQGFYRAPKEDVADFSIAGDASSTELPFRLINNHIFAPVRVNGQGPYPFLFDTGAGNVVSKALAKELALDVQGAIPSFGSGAGIMEGGLAGISRLSVGNAILHGQIFSVLPLDQLEPAEGTPILGLVGYEVFRRFVIKIDYSANKIVLIDPKTFNAKEAGTPVSFVFHDHIPEVEGSFEGIPARYNVDVGARFELTLTASYVNNNALKSKSRKGVEAVFGWGIGGAIHGFVTRGRNMTVGAVPVPDVVTNFSSEDRGGFSGSIGSGLLKRFIVTFDYGNHTIYFKPRSDVASDTGQFDRAGMWLNESSDGYEVMDVFSDSPAQVAGLHAGDRIVAIDGTAVKRIPLYDLRKRLRNQAPGTVVKVRVKRRSAIEEFTITLRDLI